jgi:hypothetical protein
MKATEVKVLAALNAGESYVEPKFLLVETARRDDGEAVTTIDVISAESGHGWKVRTLGQSVPLSHAGAREWAVSYAASRDIPIVYERDENDRGRSPERGLCGRAQRRRGGERRRGRL